MGLARQGTTLHTGCMVVFFNLAKSGDIVQNTLKFQNSCPAVKSFRREWTYEYFIKKAAPKRRPPVMLPTVECPICCAFLTENTYKTLYIVVPV